MFRPTMAKRILTGIMIFCMVAFNTAPVLAAPFQDISGHWARDIIVRLASQQIVSGYGGRFNPNGGVTRAEFSAMMVKAMGMADQAQIVKGSPTGFTDVSPAHWASGFVTVAAELGIISGYPDKTFKPGALIRRDEITSVLVRALNLDVSEDMADPAGVFKDGGQIPAWAAGAVRTAYDYNLISGFPEGRFYPGRSASRGETAVLVAKVLEQLGQQYTFYATIENVDETNSQITLDIAGQIESFSYRPDVAVLMEKLPVTMDQVSGGSKAMVILDSLGYISFMQVTNKDYSDFKVAVNGSEAQALAMRKSNVVSAAARQWTTALIVTQSGRTRQVSDLVKARGGTVKFTDAKIDFVLARVSPALYAELKTNPLVAEITQDSTVKVERLAPAEEPLNPGETAVSSNENNPGQSLNYTKEAIKAPEFVKVTHSDGKGQIIAVIDTGIDAGHPDLQKTSDDKRKIVAWQDFTHEGDIDTSSAVEPTGQTVNLANGPYHIGGIRSAGSRFKYGYIREADLHSEEGAGYDINFNTDNDDIFAVLLADSSRQAVYDTVYVDTNANQDFTDEKPLRVFANQPDYADFSKDKTQNQFNFVVTEISPDGSQINLGFDGNDHGTHVAGTAAANGRVKGVAPGAQIMALKVLDIAGYGDLSTITEAMSYAVNNGAKIINLSLGFPGRDISGGSIPAKLLNNLTEKYGVIFVVAAGNDGPGLTTVATPGDAESAISVGGFNTPQMWRNDYGWTVPNRSLWFFSAAGPRKDGAVSPSLVAPGSVNSTVPLRKGSWYFLSEGTSMASPHVAGALALLMEVVQRNNLKVSPAFVKKALEAGADPIANYSAVEQGYGALNLPMAWAELLSMKEAPDISVQIPNRDFSDGEGIYFRDGLPERLVMYLKNSSSRLTSLNLNQTGWIKPRQSVVNIPAGKTRAVAVDLEVPADTGLFSTIISAEDRSTGGKGVQVLATVVNPYELARQDGYSVTVSGQQTAAQYKRYFFRVPPGAGVLNAEISVPNGAGRSRVFVYNPKGQSVAETEFAGVNPDTTVEKAVITHRNPVAGVWEVVVYSSAGLSAYGLNISNYTLKVGLSDVTTAILPQSGRNVIIGVLPKTLRSGRANYVTVQVRDRYTKRPYQGFLEVDGRLYYSYGGQVMVPAGGENLTVRTVPDSRQVRPWEINFTMPFGQNGFQ